ncbi:hypothetical protein HRQ91_10385 [Treponema parvum]|uniref:Uracil-DNA glycosylase n=1 Tax=Treponema parvum TaxID=138851 RepID=A0A975F5T2_9SPIR|nr:hypothetical protein [Treponema parvum]QTQ14838.1 hypothetical protein HRQ91_10385 [Treponema parvum]
MKPLLYDEIDQAEMNAAFREKGWSPLYTASPHSRIALIGQAPGRLEGLRRTDYMQAAFISRR